MQAMLLCFHCQFWNLGTCVVLVELHTQQRMSKHNDDCLSVAVLPEHSIIIFHIVHHQQVVNLHHKAQHCEAACVGQHVCS